MGLASAWAPLPGGPLPPPFSTAALPLGGFPPLVRFPLCRAKISQVSWLGDEDNPPNGVSLSVSSSVELCCDQKKRKSGKPEEASEEQHPGPSSAGLGFQRVLAPQITDRALPGVFPGRALQFGVVCHLLCSPVTLTPCQADRLLVTNHPCRLHRAGLLGPTGRAGEAKRVQTRGRNLWAPRSGHASKARPQRGRPLSSPLSL